MNHTSLRGKVALIVGAGRGPAPAVAMALAEQQAVVALNDLSPTLLDPLAERIRAEGGRAESYIADATRGMPLRAMIDEVLADWERIDILVVNPRIQPQSALIEMDEWDWQRTVEMNLNGPFLLMQTAARLMREQGGGVILVIADDRQDALDAPGHAAYAASQRGLLSLAQSAARELIAYNIRVYTLCPDEAILNAAEQLPAWDETVRNGSQSSSALLSRFAAHLCSQDSASLTGQVFQVSPSAVSPQPELPWFIQPERSTGEQE